MVNDRKTRKIRHKHRPITEAELDLMIEEGFREFPFLYESLKRSAGREQLFKQIKIKLIEAGIKWS